jgi:hypothetical protein
VAVQDIFKALQTNQFEMLVDPLQESLKNYQEQIRKKKEDAALKKQSEPAVENDNDDDHDAHEPSDE